MPKSISSSRVKSAIDSNVSNVASKNRALRTIGKFEGQDLLFQQLDNLIELRNCTNKRDANELLKSVHDKLQDRVPSESEFISKFVHNLSFTNQKTTNR